MDGEGEGIGDRGKAWLLFGGATGKPEGDRVAELFVAFDAELTTNQLGASHALLQAVLVGDVLLTAAASIVVDGEGDLPAECMELEHHKLHVFMGMNMAKGFVGHMVQHDLLL